MRFCRGCVDGVFREDLVVALLVEVCGLVVLDCDLVEPFNPARAGDTGKDGADGVAVFGG